MKRHLSPSLVLFVLFVASLFFQNGKVQAQIAAWDMQSLTGGTNNFGPSPLAATTTAANVTVGSLTRGTGVTQSGTGAAKGWGGTGWSTTDSTAGISGNQFFTFTVVPNSGYSLSLTAFDTFDYRRSASGPQYALVQYQINSGSFVSIGVDTFSSTSSSGASIGSKDLSSISALQNIPSTSVITFRFVPFGATAAGGTFYIFSKANNTLSDFSLKGTVAVATSNTITTGAVTTTPFALANCSATASGSVAFTSVGTFTSGNVYTAQLSNASGSFASPVNIGTLSNTASGSQSISITIPAGTPTGSGYLIQVISSNPGVTGTASSAFTINQSGVCSTASTDYFRSVTDGNWNSTSTWQSSPDNTTWISATAVPDSAANTITIRNGDTVTVSASVTAADQLVVATGGTLSISAGKTITITNGAGTDLDVFGTVTNAGAMVTTGASVIFEANSFYNHTAAVASLIPAATWNSSSTCTVSGMTTSGTAPTAAGLKQTFGNFVWNCSGQTAFININDTLFGTTGTLSMQASGASSGLGLNSTPGTTRVYNFGAITVSGGILELSFLGATGTVGQTVANVNGDVNVNGTGYLALAVEGTSITTSLNQGIYASILTIGGNLNVNTSSGAKFANAGSHYSMIIFTKNGTQNYTNSAVVSSTDNYGVDYAITPNSTMALQSRLSLDGTYLGQLSVSGTINLGTQIVSDSTTNISATSQIPADFILSGNTTASVSATMVKDSNFIVVSSTNGFTKGMSITGTNIPTNTFVADTVSGSKIVLTKKAIGSGTNIVTGTATCKVITANAGGLMYTAASGSVQVLGFRKYHSTADYEFDGAITGDFATASAPSLNTVRNLTINNAAGVLLSTSNNNLTVTGALNLTSGLFTIPTTDTLTIAGTVPSPSGTIDASTGATSAVVLKNTGFTLNASIFNPAGTIRNLINNPASGTNTLSGNFTITNTLGLTSGVLDNSGNRLTFQTGNIPIVRTAGTLTVNNTSSLIFGTAGNLGGNAFTIPNAMFTTAPSIKTFIINRTNSISFGNQPFTINDSLVLTAGVLNNGNDSLTFQNGNVPISRTSGTLTMGTTATLIFGTAGNTSGNAFTIPNSVFTSAPSISNFAMNRANTLTLGNQSLTLSNTLTITSGTLDANTQTLNGTANVTMTGGTLSLAKNGVKLPELTGTYNLTGGTVNIYGSGTGASADTIRAVNYFNLSSGSTGDRVLSSTQVTGIAGTFTPSTNTYVITGSHVDFNGTATQNIPAFSFDTLSFSSVSGTPSKTLAGNVNVKSTLNLKNSIQLNLSNSFLNLNSTAGKTARISTVSSGVGVSYSGSGRFVIERYYPARRAWHLTTAPVTADAGRSLFSSWQIGGASTSGSGTYITSPTPNAGNGLDASPQNNYSLKQYINGTQSFLNIDSTKTRNIAGTTGVAGTPDNLVYFLFVRGDRTPANLVPPTCNSTTIRDTGKIQYNTQTFTTSSTLGNFTAIGNPYASPVDFNSITLNNSLRKFWAWDPTLNDVGGYVLVDGISGSYVTSPAVGTSITKNIQSSQGIFVQTTSAGTPSVVFSESNKNDSNNLAIFRTQGSPVPSMVANLYKNDNGSLHFADGTLAQFDDNWSGDVDFYDGIKFGNVNEQFSLYRNNKSLAIERRPLVQICDTLFFKLTKTTQRLYSLEISFSDFNLTALKGVLVDKFTGTHTDLNLQGSENIDFAVTSDPASAAADRFYIVFKSSNPLPVTISSIRAWKQNQSGIVEWKVENELSMAGYELQKSTDGIHFNDVQLFLPAGNGVGKTYQWEDVNLQTGYNYYRVESKGQNGTVNYSEVVKILNSKISSHSIVLFPNPSNGTTIGVQFNEWPEGVYSLRCMNALGQLVKETTVIHHGGSSVYTLKPAKTLAKGIYQIEIVGEDGTQQVIPLVVE